MYFVSYIIIPWVYLFLESTNSTEGYTEWKLVDVANRRQLGSKERVKAKIDKIKQFAREAAKGTAPQMLPYDDRVEVQQLRETLQERDREAEVC